MEDAPSELYEKLKQAYEHIEPMRTCTGAKVFASGNAVIVRIYSQKKEATKLLPPPYQIYRYDTNSSSLWEASEDERRTFQIKNYK